MFFGDGMTRGDCSPPAYELITQPTQPNNLIKYKLTWRKLNDIGDLGEEDMLWTDRSDSDTMGSRILDADSKKPVKLQN